MVYKYAITQSPQHTWLNGGQSSDARKYRFVYTQVTPHGPRIDAAVAGIAPGELRTIYSDTSNNIFRVQRADDGTPAAILDWTPHQVWHAATQQLLLGGRRGTIKLTAYSDIFGRWREMTCPFGRITNGTVHWYGNICQDGAGNVYYGTTEAVSQTWRHNPVTQAWARLADTPSYSQLGSSMEWFPEANGGSGGLIKTLDFATSTLRVILLNAAETTWSTLASGVPNSQHALARYHPSHNRVLILGGTNTQTAATFLEADGTVTASATAIPANIHGMSPACWVLAHPSGCWLVRSGASGNVYAAWPNDTYDDITWVDLGAAPDAALTNPTVAWEPARGLVLITAETGLFAWRVPTLDEPGTGGAGAEIVITAAGGGTALLQPVGGTGADVLITAAGAGTGIYWASGGAGAEVSVASAGGGTASLWPIGGAGADLVVTAGGAGTGEYEASGGSGSGVVVAASGAGTPMLTPSGGSSAAVLVTAAGAGTASGGPSVGFDEIIEAGLSAAEMLRVIMAAVSGRTEGIGTDTERYYSVDGTKPRLTVTFDAQGNRTSVTLDATP